MGSLYPPFCLRVFSWVIQRGQTGISLGLSSFYKLGFETNLHNTVNIYFSNLPVCVLCATCCRGKTIRNEDMTRISPQCFSLPIRKPPADHHVSETWGLKAQMYSTWSPPVDSQSWWQLYVFIKKNPPCERTCPSQICKSRHSPAEESLTQTVFRQSRWHEAEDARHDSSHFTDLSGP